MTLELHTLAEAGLLTLLAIFLLLGASVPKSRPWERVLTGSRGRFSDRDRHLIRLYFQGEGDAAASAEALGSPAVAEADRILSLPPETAGLSLPRRLERRLARLPEGLKRLRIGRDVMLIELHTGQVLDVLKDVCPEAEVKTRRPARALLPRRRRRRPVSDHPSSLSS